MHHHYHYHKTIPSIIIWKTVGFLFFLILLAVSNYLIPNFNNIPMYVGIVQFFNSNFAIIFAIFIVDMISEIMWIFNFPFNILAPVFSSILSVYIITFIYKIFQLVDSYTNTNVTLPIVSITTLVSFIVFLTGYLTIIARHGKSEKNWEETKGRSKKRMEKKTKNVEWGDIGNEFKNVLYNIGRSLNEAFEGKDKKRKKRR